MSSPDTPDRMTRTPFRLPPLRLLCLGMALALGHAALATWAMRAKSTTADELAHITAGYVFNHENDYRMQPENGILPQRWQALPATLSQTDFPALTTPAWKQSTVWMVGYDFFYHSSNNPDRLLFDARAMNSLFGAALVLFVFLWSYQLWGTAGALVSGIFCALCPTMLAQSGVATSDMCAAFFFVAASSAYWWQLHDSRKRVWLLSAVLLGLAAVAKYSTVLLLPFAAVLALIRIFEPEPLQLAGRTFRSRFARAGAIAVSTVAQGVVAGATIWAFCGFRYSAFNPGLPAGEFSMPWNVVLAFGGAKAALIEFCRHWHLLPEAWLYGLSYVLQFSRGRAAFIDGDYSLVGWADFFPRTFLYKTPPALLVGVIAAGLLVALHLRTLNRAQIRRHLTAVAPLLVVFAGYWIFSITSHLNIGHRHLLPTYPLLYILCGALGWSAQRAWQQSRKGGAAGALLATGLLAWQAVASAGIHPHYLAYFSPLVGGPREGYRHLVDSSLDWGQDLPAWKQWLATHREAGEPAYLSYFGADEPRRFVNDVVLIPSLPSFNQPRPPYDCRAGVYAISATMLQHVYRFREAVWSEELETRYQALRSGHATPETWADYDELRFARLCVYLRAREPDDFAGYSILIYRLSTEQLAQALDSDLPAFNAAREKLRASRQ